MSSFSKPERSNFYHGFSHCEYFVSNAKQAADYHSLRFGFKKVAYRGLETGSRDYVSHVVQAGQVISLSLSLSLFPFACSRIHTQHATHATTDHLSIHKSLKPIALQRNQVYCNPRGRCLRRSIQM